MDDVEKGVIQDIYETIDSIMTQIGKKEVPQRMSHYHELLHILIVLLIVFDFSKDTEAVLQEEMTCETVQLYRACKEHWRDTQKEYLSTLHKE